jgi:large subunit ribosomal protein L13
LWHHVDASNQVLGRLAPQLARLLMGKHKPLYSPTVDCGDYIVVTNAKDVALTGTKRTTKLYRWHTGWMGGLKTLTARQMFERDPGRVVTLAVKGMMPDNKLRDVRLTRLRVFPGPEHTCEQQLSASRAYAPEYIAASVPGDVAPRPRADTGAFVVDAANVLSADALKKLEASFVEIKHDDAFAAKYDEWRRERTARAQASLEERDADILKGGKGAV